MNNIHRIRFVVYGYMLSSILCSYIYAVHEWAWTKTYQLTDRDRSTAKKCAYYTTPTHESEPFTQLIFSWNAQRPQKGHITFYVQGCDATSGVWSSWHEAIKWGKGLQESFLTTSDGIAHYAHVRFEVCAGKKCNAYRLRIKACNGADLSLFNTFTITCADFTQFKAESIQELTDLPAVYIKRVARRSQFVIDHSENKRLCSPTSTAMLTEFITGQRCIIQQCVQHIYDKNLDTYGNWAFNMAHAYELSNGKAKFYVTRLNSFRDLHAYLMRGAPVAVSVRGILKGAPQTYTNGHLLVVVGYNPFKKQVICHDPAFQQDHMTLHAYDLSHFLRAWECSRRLAYCVDRSL